MPVDVMTAWLMSGLAIELCHLEVWPVENPMFADSPLSVRRGQSEVFFLQTADTKRLILKKLHRGRELDRRYMEAVSTLLPDHEGFRCGRDRRIICKTDLVSSNGHYSDRSLASWLDGALLLPMIDGIDWAALADDVREGEVVLSPDQRLELCRQLSALVELLENSQCAHRDLSSGNVFINTKTWSVCLIDFDSCCHPSLRMPQYTTCGTEGYAPPYAWLRQTPDPSATWCPGGDRYALALINVEFLLLEQGVPMTGEGGIFDQDELRARRGMGLSRIRSQLQKSHPQVVALFDQAIASTNCAACPSPQQWLSCCRGAMVAAPQLHELGNPNIDSFTQILRQRRPAAPIWPAPRLDDMAQPTIAAAPVPVVVQLPADSWQ
jgi:serine/threonine protein kinase